VEDAGRRLRNARRDGSVLALTDTMMSGRRLVLRVALVALVGVMAFVVFAAVVAPMVSRAIAMAPPPPGARPARPLPPDYEPLHKGHIDTSTGLYVREDEDLALRGAPAFVLRRTYRTRDSRSRAFGIGGSHTGDWYLVGDGRTFQWADLILEDGGRIHYERVTRGTTVVNARYEHWDTPTEFYGSELAWDGTEWLVREHDGTLLTFLACGPRAGLCGLVERREPDGQTITFRRNATGRLMWIETAKERIDVEYGEGERIARVRDVAGHAVAYTYDAKGRLRESVESGGTKRSYDYDDRDRLIRIQEPGRIVENRYDAADMCIWQRVTFPADPAHGIPAAEEPYIFQISYVMENGRVHQTETRESNAPSHRRVFTVHGYLESETYGFDTDRAKTITYERMPATGLVSGMTLKCGGNGRWHTSRTVPANPATEDEVKAELLATPCSPAADGKPAR
jgi:YD repeat-containing protein